MSREAKLHVLERYLAACERRDISAIVGCFEKAGTVLDPSGEQVGAEAIRRYFENIYKDLAALSFKVGQVSWCGPACAVPWKGHGRRRDGSDMHYEGVDVFTFAASHLIRQLWAFWTPDDLLGSDGP